MTRIVISVVRSLWKSAVQLVCNWSVPPTPKQKVERFALRAQPSGLVAVTARRRTRLIIQVQIHMISFLIRIIDIFRLPSSDAKEFQYFKFNNFRLNVSRTSWINKTEWSANVRYFVQQAKRLYEHEVHIFRSDNGGELSTMVLWSLVHGMNDFINTT